MCADRLGLSIRERTMFAASVAKAVSRQSAWRRGQQVRLKKAESIKSDLKLANKVSVHWDEKNLKIIAGQQSNRVAVYISSADSQKIRMPKRFFGY